MSRRRNLYCLPVALVAIIAFLHLSRLNFNVHLFFSSEDDYNVRQPYYKFNEDVASYLPLSASEGIKPTSMLRHAPGFTILDKLYMMNSTLFIVSDSPQDFPPFPSLVSTGYPWTDGFPAENAKRVPTPKQIQIISTQDAPKQFVMQPVHVQGVTFLCNDAPQYIPNYFAFVGEILFGLWRTYSSLDPEITAGGETGLPPPRRLVFPYTPFNQWRDSAGFNQYVFRALFPGASLEFLDDWMDRIDSGRPYVFDRVVLQDRMASFTGPAQAATQRMAAESLTIPSSDNWFTPFRSKVVEASLTSTKFAAKKKGHLDALIDFGKEILNGRVKRFGPAHTITYISRQSSSRRTLSDADHNKLVAGLKELEAKFGYEVFIVEMEKLSKEEQITLASKSTIMMGVHGGGLTASLWMEPTPKSAVFEFFQPGSFKTEYQWTVQEGLKLPYFAFWNDKAFSASEMPEPHVGDEFESTQIPLNADLVIEMIQARLAPEEQQKRRYPPQIRR